MGLIGRPWAGFIARVREPTWGKISGGTLNARIPVGVFPQLAPEPGEQGGAYGVIPTRPAQIQTFTSYHDTTKTQEDRFVAVIIGPNPEAAYPRGRQAPFVPRANIRVPAAVAYGSLFNSDTPTYGLG